MIRRTPRSTRTYTRLPYTTFCRSLVGPDGTERYRRDGPEARTEAAGRSGFHRRDRRSADRGYEDHRSALDPGLCSEPCRAQLGREPGRVHPRLRVWPEQCGLRPGGVGLSRRHLWRTRCEVQRSEEHTSDLKSLMRISYAVFCLKQKT